MKCTTTMITATLKNLKFYKNAKIIEKSLKSEILEKLSKKGQKEAIIRGYRKCEKLVFFAVFLLIFLNFVTSYN